MPKYLVIFVLSESALPACIHQQEQLLNQFAGLPIITKLRLGFRLFFLLLPIMSLVSLLSLPTVIPLDTPSGTPVAQKAASVFLIQNPADS